MKSAMSKAFMRRRFGGPLGSLPPTALFLMPGVGTNAWYAMISDEGLPRPGVLNAYAPIPGLGTHGPAVRAS